MKRLRNQSGFTLIETTVALGVMAIGAYALLSQYELASKTQNTAKLSADATALQSEIRMVLNKSTVCRDVLAGQTIAEGANIVIYSATRKPASDLTVVAGASGAAAVPKSVAQQAGMAVGIQAASPSLAGSVALGPKASATVQAGSKPSPTPTAPAYVNDPNIIAAAGQKYGALNIESVKLKDLRTISGPIRSANLEVVTQKPSDTGGGFFGSQSAQTVKIPIVLTDNGTGKVEDCFGEQSIDNAALQSCQSLGGTYHASVAGQSEFCELYDIRLSALPQNGPTRTVAGFSCDMDPRYCPAGQVQALVEDSTPICLNGDSGKCPSGWGRPGTKTINLGSMLSSTGVKPIVKDVIINAHFRLGNHHRGDYTIYLGDTRVGVVAKNAGSNPVVNLDPAILARGATASYIGDEIRIQNLNLRGPSVRYVKGYEDAAILSTTVVYRNFDNAFQ